MTFHLADTNGLRLGRFSHMAAPHGIATRLGGISPGRYASLNLGPRSGDDLAYVRANRDRLLTTLSLGSRSLIGPRQVHGAHVAAYRHGDPLPAAGVVDGDAIITTSPDVALIVLAADCAPLLMHDPARGVVAAVHCGWRGTASAIARAAVRAMSERFGCDPAGIRAGLGPAIGRCCYEVGPEVVAAIDAATPGGASPLTDPLSSGKSRIDIVAANVAQLIDEGLDPALIATSATCTACRTDLYYSHRREGEPTGRNAAVIALSRAT